MDKKKKAAQSARAAASSHRKRRRSKKQRRRINAVLRLTAVMVTLLLLAAVVIVVAPKRSHTVIINHPTETKSAEVAAPLTAEDDAQILRIDANHTVQNDQEDAQAPVITLAPTVETTAEPAPETEVTTQVMSEQAEDADAQTLEVGAPVEDAGAQPAENTAQTADAAPQESSFEYLPVYKRAETFERKIAITVDDCFQVENLQTICRAAYNSGGKLTIFPIGENLSKQGMADTLKTCAFKLGFEIENHTWSHSRVFRLTEFEMAKEIWQQSQGLNMTLGANYEQHFFRLMGGDGSSDQRTHNYLKQLGFKGIAEWSCSGSDADMNEIKENLTPGAIYLFHTTDADTQKLKEFIPYVASQGYQMVTLNELLGFEPNAVTQYSAQSMPVPQAYEEEYRTHKVGDYAYNIVLMQDKLRSMGLLVMEGESTGYYGQQTAEAIQQFQQSQGLPVTGIADAETQKRLLKA